MAVKTDDEDIRDVRFFMEHGGNGDYYLNLIEYPKDVNDGRGKLPLRTERINFRCAMSGGNCPTDVKMAIANLYRTMEAAGLNNHPKNDK